MSSEYAAYGRQLASGAWAEINPTRCPCHGTGVMLSNLDSWHKCPIHRQDDHLGNLRRAFATFGEMAMEIAGLSKSDFLYRVEEGAQRQIGYDGASMSMLRGALEPEVWVSIAEEVSNLAICAAEDAAAHKAGFMSAAEQRWHQDASRWERRQAGFYG